MNAFQIITMAAITVVLIILLIALLIFFAFFRVWLKAFQNQAEVNFFDLLGMSFRKINMNALVDAKIMAIKNGVFDRQHMSTVALQRQYLAGVDLMAVVTYMCQQKANGKETKDFDILCEQYLAGKLPV